MNQIINSKRYDLEDRTSNFAKSVRLFINKLPRTIVTIEDGKQLVRSSGSIGANYIEANESLSKKDFLMRIKICKKEAKESCYWLNLLSVSLDLEKGKQLLLKESTELMKIFGSILEKSK
jgi:four helix bundle protein